MNKILVVIVSLILAGCADSVSFTTAAFLEPVGFLYGLWHGMILPFAWIVSLFDDYTAIYAIYNNGGWYDFGYMLGLGVFTSSGIKLQVKKQKKQI